MPDTTYFESKQLYNTIRQYSEEIKRFNNQLHSLRILPAQNKEAIKSLEKMKLQFEKEIKILEVKVTSTIDGMETRPGEKYQQHKSHR